METNPSNFFEDFIKFIRINIKTLKKNSRKFNRKYPNLQQTLQINVLYFFAIASFFCDVVATLDEIPDSMFIPPFLKSIVDSALLRFLLAPQRSYVVYLLSFEFIINRSVFRFSKLFKYNLLLITLLGMLQNLLIGYWKILFSRDISDFGADLDIPLSIAILTGIYSIFFWSYVYSYFSSIRGKFPELPGADWLTDSICFWLRIKTPRMRSGRFGSKRK